MARHIFFCLDKPSHPMLSGNIVIAEQFYRALSILNNLPYHHQ
ncbi:MAG: 23S rRNA (pseudouridine(1915)-N(3))-methyltransferase RlmH [Bacteroidaceae bacterium]|nr:23S rRNA (pseudouridine(1915)-N(3))-methyltransferase RlmH [Bacteroidaceae bacterium]